METDLKFLLEPPKFSVSGKLTVEPLAPLSMVTSMPGKYYRSQPAPTNAMIFGMLENALGFHLTDKVARDRNKLIKKIARKHKCEIKSSDVGFESLLQFHIKITMKVTPDVIHFDDYWSRHAKHTDSRHIDGSWNYDYRAISTLNKVRSEEEKLNAKEMIGYFPQYYVSPTQREYVIPQGEYKFGIETSETISEILEEKLQDSIAPLYLGSNDGWVEASYEIYQ